jgi:hypothetical protein
MTRLPAMKAATLAAALLLVSCVGTVETPNPSDAAVDLDAGAAVDAGPTVDSGTPFDAGPATDAGFDAGQPGVDAGHPDAGAPDSGTMMVDAGVVGTTPIFLATGYQNRRVRSLDATHWTDDVSNPANPLDDIGTGVAFGAGRVIVSSHSGLVTSTDGRTWTKLPAPLPQAWPGLGGSAAVWSGGQFVVVAGEDSWTSPDGVTFTQHTQAGAGATHWQAIAQGGGHILVVGDSNSSGGDRKVSEDGVTWHDWAEGGPGLVGAAYGAGVFVFVGASGRRAWTADGVTITTTDDTSMGDFQGVVFDGAKFVAVGGGGLTTSTDGKTWAKTPMMYLPGVSAFGGGLFLTTTWESNVLTSTNGSTWTTVFSGASGSPPLARIVYGLVQGP